MFKSRSKGINRKRGVLSEYQSTTASVLTRMRRGKWRVQSNGSTNPDLVSQFVHQIGRELVVTFGKTNAQVQVLLSEAKLNDYLAKNPIALHDSPHQWAIKLLTMHDDSETLERYYSS